MIFKALFALLTAACMFYFLILTRKSALRRLFVLSFFGVGIVFILQPDLTTSIARLVGIGRGADLVFYLSILFLFFLCFNFYVRFRALEERQNQIVRELALRHPVQREDGAARGGGATDRSRWSRPGSGRDILPS
jgi:small membrane protein